MSEKNRRWLMAELPSLVESDVLSEFYAESLRDHYAQASTAGKRLSARTVCGILGALLIGGGVILLFGHNWNALSRTMRTVFALAPLVATQALCLYGLRSKKTSRAWREPVAGLNSLAVAAAMALVGQTYHIPGDLSGFLLVWMLMTLPLIYLFQAVLPALIYLAGITAWSAASLYDGGNSLPFWLLYAAVLPFAILTLRRYRLLAPGAVLGWGLCLQAVSIGTVLERGLPGLWITVYTALFALLYLVGTYGFADAPSVWFNPFSIIGRAGTVIVALLLTYEWPWDSIGWHYARFQPSFVGLSQWTDAVIVLALVSAALVLLVKRVCRGELWLIPLGVAPVVGILGWSAVSATGSPAVGMLLFNGYVFAMGLAWMLQGVFERRISLINGGMGILSVLFLLRFFDSDIPMLARGILFVLLGIGFLAVNLRRRRLDEGEERQ